MFLVPQTQPNIQRDERGIQEKNERFVKLNVLESSENRELATGNGVMGTPTLMFFCQGRPIGQTVSFMPEEDLRKVLEDMLERSKQCIRQSSDLRNYVV